MSGARTRLTRLLAELQREHRALALLSSELARLAPSLAAPEPDRRDLGLVAIDLHHYYTAVETAFERVARLLDEDVPSGPDSHRQLIDQMALEIPGLRDALIDTALRDWLQELRRFRHFFRNAYCVELDPSELGRHVAKLLANAPAFIAALDRFAAWLAAARDLPPE